MQNGKTVIVSTRLVFLQTENACMKKFSLFAFAAALFAFGFTGPASAEETKWGWGECESSKILSVENESHDQSVAESTMPEGTEPAETTEGG
jgi:hypothetical protein